MVNPRATLVGLLFLVFGGALLIWLAPALLAAALSGPETKHAIQDRDADGVDAWLEDTRAALGLAPPRATSEQDGVRHAIHTLPAGMDAAALSDALRARAAAEGLELYARVVDDVDAEIRLYAGATLRHRLLFVEQTPDPPALSARPWRERPLLALIISGLGDRGAPEVTGTVAPLTLAIRPRRPFSLQLGRDAIRAWHEVLLDLSDSGLSVVEARTALPWASGVLGAPTASIGDWSRPIITHPVGEAPAEDRRRLLPVQRPRHMSAAVSLRRARRRAISEGCAALVIDADAPDLAAVLEWAAAANGQGYRLVLASEAARAADLRGRVDPSPR